MDKTEFIKESKQKMIENMNVIISDDYYIVFYGNDRDDIDFKYVNPFYKLFEYQSLTEELRKSLKENDFKFYWDNGNRSKDFFEIFGKVCKNVELAKKLYYKTMRAEDCVVHLRLTEEMYQGAIKLIEEYKNEDY